jgi:hypothetical protein
MGSAQWFVPARRALAPEMRSVALAPPFVACTLFTAVELIAFLILEYGLVECVELICSSITNS